MKKIKYLLCTILSACMLLTACEKQESLSIRTDTHRLETNLLLARTLFGAMLSERNSSQPFEIIEVIRRNHILEVKVKGGSDTGAFQFIWDGLIRESYPMGIQLILKKQAEGDFDAQKELLLSVDLRKIIGKKSNVGDYHFFVINGSKLQTSILHPDGAVTYEDK